MKQRYIFFVLVWTSLFAENINLSLFEKGLYSSYGEDGVLAKIFSCMPKESNTYVELGAGEGAYRSNVYLLRLQGWRGTSLDRIHVQADLSLYKEFITAENVNHLFEKYGVGDDFGLLSIRLKYNSFHIWNAISPKYHPAVVVVRYNKYYSEEEEEVVKYRPFFCGGDEQEFAAGIFSFCRLAEEKGYTLVYIEEAKESLFFIRSELLHKYNLHFIVD